MANSKSLMFLSCLVLGLIITACSSGLPAKKPLAAFDELFYVFKEKDGKTVKGFMDKTGRIVLGPWDVFEWNGKKYGAEKAFESDEQTEFRVMPFIEGLAGICFYDKAGDPETAKCGFIDKSGKLAIEPKFRAISYFSEGLAAVSEDGRKFGYSDKTGKIVIEQKFLSNAAFIDGLAVASEDIAKAGYIDKSGKYAIEPKFMSGSNFGDGFAIVQVSSAPQSIIIDKTGKQIFDLKDKVAKNTDFYYKATFYRPFYKADGEYEVDETLPAFSEGLAMHSRESNLLESDVIGFIRTDGSFEIQLDKTIYDRIRPFSQGFAPTRYKASGSKSDDAGEWTFIDGSGKPKITRDNSYNDARPFSEGMAAVQKRGESKYWGFVDSKFFPVTDHCFDQASDFHGGLAFVHIATRSGKCEKYKDATQTSEEGSGVYIDVAGNEIKPQW